MSTTTTTDNSEWTVLEKLLLTQAVYKYGENMWFQVARVLKQHGLIQPNQRQSDFFSQKNCQFQYYLLVQNLEAEKEVYRSIDLQNDMPVVVRIARQLYLQRVEEVKAELKRDEEKFGQLAQEIELIKSGQWDEKLKEQLSPADREAMDKEAASKKIKEDGTIDSTNNNDASEENTSNGKDEHIASIEAATKSSPSLPAPVTDEENKLLENVTQQDNSMKRTSSETTILSASSAKRFRLEESKIDQSNNSSEDQVITTAIAMAANVINKDDVNKASIPQETAPSRPVDAEIPAKISTNDLPKENASITAPAIATEIATFSAATNDSMPSIEVGTDNESSSASNMSVAAHTENAATAVETETKERTNGQYTAVDAEFSVNDTSGNKPPEPSTSDLQQQTINQEQPAQQNIIEPVIIQQAEQQPYETVMHVQNGKSNQSQEQHGLPQLEEQQLKLPMSAVCHLPKIIIPEVSSSSSSPYHRFHKDQSASPISKLHNNDSNNHSIMTPDEEEFSARSETATPTSTTSAIERRKTSSSDQRQKAWQKNIYLLWQEIANHKNGTIFMNPIKKSHAPLYDKVVKQPLYLKTIKNRVRDGVVKTTAEFERDIVLMLTNSLMYNKEGTETYQMALEMLDDVREQFRLFKSADGYWEYD